MKLTRIFLLVLLLPCLLRANNDLRLADRAYASQHYYMALNYYQAASSGNISKSEKARATFQMAECKRKMSDFQGAAKDYSKAINLKCTDDKAYLYLAQMQQSMGQYENALKNFETYSQLVPSDPAAATGISACKMAINWIDAPTCYQVKNEAELNTRAEDFCPTWLNTKHSGIVFTSKRAGQSGKNTDPVSGSLYSDLFEAKKLRGGKWEKPATVSGDLNMPASNDGASCITRNGSHIFFTRCEQKKKQWITCKIYYAEKRGNTWGAPVLIDFGLDATTLDSFNFRHPAVSMNEEVMIFSSDMTGTTGGEKSDLWISTFNRSTRTWGRPVNMGKEINTAGREGFPYISDENQLYFSSDGHLGMGGLDIFKANRINTTEWKWNTIVNMKFPINSPADDFGILFDGKKQKGYFTSNRDGSKGGDDIWSFDKCYGTVSGKVFDCENNMAVSGSRVLMTCSDGTVYETSTDASGFYKFPLSEDAAYVITVENEKAVGQKGVHYYNLEESKRVKLTSAELSCCEEKKIDFCIIPYRDSVEINFPAVLYDLSMATLRPESKDSLDYLYNLLVQNPNFVIELDAHTDCRGTSEKNRVLAQARAQACVDYLISKGIAPERLIAKGWGEDRPLKMPNGQVLTEKYIKTLSKDQQEKYHQLNRRTVFRVVRTDYVDPKAPSSSPTKSVKISKDFFDESGEAEE
jgi:peptidoglycan-associated lipoprotein